VLSNRPYPTTPASVLIGARRDADILTFERKTMNGATQKRKPFATSKPPWRANRWVNHVPARTRVGVIECVGRGLHVGRLASHSSYDDLVSGSTRGAVLVLGEYT
jgi:hypothetical protein